jgi:uncharacterized protein YkwD
MSYYHSTNVHNVVNDVRCKYNQSQLSLNANLCDVADKYAARLNFLGGKLVHVDPVTLYNTGDRILAAGIIYKRCGENLTVCEQPEDSVSNWMSSQQHKDNMLNPNYNCEGLGFYWRGSSYIACQVLAQL